MAVLTGKEQEKLRVINEAITNNMTNAQAAKMLGLSVRQVKRLKKTVRISGHQGIVHKLKGTQGNRRINTVIKAQVMTLIKKHYADFKPGFATEKLQENHEIVVSPETVRKWMIEEKLWKERKQKKTGQYRSWRPRKEYFGELQQFDGSYHLWFETRFVDANGIPLEVCLLASIDDATGNITKASFADNEGVVAVFLFWKAYVITVGKTRSVYLDKFSTYKINHKAAVDNHELMTQFERAMKDLAIYLIPAHSPQAKGRIERLFDTLQDRLVKEMRLANIHTPEEGNKFLEEVFIPKFNNKFAVIPAKDGDVHRVLSKSDKKNLNRIFSVQSTRVVQNDFTIQFKSNWYQLAELQPTTVRAKDKVLIEEWLDGTIHFSVREKYLTYVVLPGKPKKAKTNPTIITSHTLNWKPPKDHPWRKPYKPKT